MACNRLHGRRQPALYLRADTQEEHEAETNALASEADMPLDQLLAAYGYKMGPDGTKVRLEDAADPASTTADHSGPGAPGRSADQPQVSVKAEQRQSPRTRLQLKPAVKLEAGTAVKTEPAAVISGHASTSSPASPAEAHKEVRLPDQSTTKLLFVVQYCQTCMQRCFCSLTATVSILHDGMQAVSR